MKIAVWFTGHAICDTVAKSLVKGFHADLHHASTVSDDLVASYDCHIAYGILRGAANVFKTATRLGKPWFNVDLGYFNSGHYEGAYRISGRGTQARWLGSKHSLGIVQDTLTLIAPPTPDVCQFFGVDAANWLHANLTQNCMVKFKSDGAEIPWNEIGLVKTFNSSLGWQALKRGIPCVSDSNHSVIGSYYKYIDTNKEIVNINAEPLFTFMEENQFTLKQIENGLAWPLIKRSIVT